LKTILVSGLSQCVEQSELRELFEQHGAVMGVDLVEGQEFGFVRMLNEDQGRKAIEALDGAMCSGVTLSVGAMYSKRQRAVEVDKSLA
jgi:RNA recognition motif-containing protein